MKKRITALILAAMMALAATACGNNGGTSGAGGDSGDAANGDLVTITYMTTGDIPTNQTDKALESVNEILKEKCNAQLKLHWIEWTDYLTNYNMMLASQTGNIDLVVTATDWLDAWPNSQNGGFMALSEDMLKENAPRTWEQVNELGHWDQCKLGDDIYVIPEDNYAQWINHGFMYRQDWATEAGLTEGVHSWKDMGTYLQYIKDNKPDVIPWDAKGKDISLVTQLAGGWQASHTDDIAIDGFGVSLFYGESKDDPYTLSRYYLEGDELVNFAKNQKAWADAGYWRTDVLNNETDTRKAMYEGLTGVDQHHTQTWYTTVRPEMDKRQPGSDVGFFYFGEETQNVVKMVITHGAMAVANKSQHPDVALQVYDEMRFNQEVYDLMQYGFEGEQYTINEDTDMLEWTEGYDNATNGVSFNFWAGRNDDLERKVSTYAWDPYETLVEEYETFAIEYPYGQYVPDKSELNQLSNLSNVYSTYMPQIAFGKMTTDPESYVAEFRQKLKEAGYEEALATAEKQLQEMYS